MVGVDKFVVLVFLIFFLFQANG